MSLDARDEMNQKNETNDMKHVDDSQSRDVVVEYFYRNHLVFASHWLISMTGSLFAY